MLKVKITKIEKKQIVATGEPYLEVTAEFTIGKEKLVKMLGYAADTTEAEIVADLNKHLQTEKVDREQRANNEKVAAQDAATEETINNLEGKEIIATEEETAEAGETKVKKSGTSKNKPKTGKSKR